jgi:hypothetical protein
VGLATTAEANWAETIALSGFVATDASAVLLVGKDSSDNDALSTVAKERLAANYTMLREVSYLGLPALWEFDRNAGLFSPPAPLHTTYAVGSFAGHSAMAVLDKKRLDVSVADIAIASFGPAPGVSRSYSSARTDATTFAPGWRFSFESCLRLNKKTSEGHIDYVDAGGDTYIFVRDESQEAERWQAPPGTGLSLWPSGTNYKLAGKGGVTATFDSSGKLISEADSNGNTVTYTWGTGGYPTQIKAANGQFITLNRANATSPLMATHTADSVSRTVEYSVAAPWTVTYFKAQAGLERTVSYAYHDGTTGPVNLLKSVTAVGFTTIGSTPQDSVQTFTYTSTGEFVGTAYPEVEDNPDAHLSIDYPSALSAAITTHGRVYSTEAGAQDFSESKPIVQNFTWYASGLLSEKCNPNASEEKWSYTYAPVTNYKLTETSPLGTSGVIRKWDYNNRGNVIKETLDLPGTEPDKVTSYIYTPKDSVSFGMYYGAIAQSSDDTYNCNAYHWPASHDLAVGRTNGNDIYHAGFRFQGVPIPKGSTIHWAKLRLLATDKNANAPQGLATALGCEAAGNPGTWVSGSHEPRLSTIYGNYRAWTPSSWESGVWQTSPDFGATVEAVVNRDDWQAGNSLCVLWLNNGSNWSTWVRMASWDETGGSYWLPNVQIYYSSEAGVDPTRDTPTTVIYPDGHRVATQMDDKGNIRWQTTQVDEDHPDVKARTEYTYADQDLGSSIVYKKAPTQQRSLISGTAESGTWATTAYSGYCLNGQAGTVTSQGVVLKEGEADQELATTQNFDAFGAPHETKDAYGVLMQHNEYDAAGRLTASSGPSITVNGVANAGQVVTHQAYDAWGHVTESYNTSTISGSGNTSWTTTAYDKAGRPSVVTTKLDASTTQSTTTFTYDSLGRQLTADNSMVTGKPALSVYDARGNVVAAWAEGACSAIEQYTLARAATCLLDNQPAFDALGRKLRSAAPGSGATVYAYNVDGTLFKQTAPDGVWSEYYYDVMGRVTGAAVA